MGGWPILLLSGALCAAIGWAGWRARQRIRSLQRLLRDLIDVIPEPVYIKDADGYYLMVNDAFCKRRSQTPDALLGKSVRELNPDPRMIEQVLQEDHEIIAGRRVFKEEHYRHAESGTDRYRVISKMASVDLDGRPVVIGANFETTRWQVAEQQARMALEAQTRARTFLQSVLDALPNPFFVKDAERRYLIINRAFSENLDLPSEQIIGQGTAEIFPPVLAAEITQLEQDMLAQPEGRIFEREFAFSAHTGELRPTILRAVVARDAEGQQVIIGVTTDITERKAIEESLRKHRDRLSELVEDQTAGLLLARDVAERANEAKTLFLANMSHELRTPMHAILGFAKIGEEKTENATVAQIKRYFERIALSGDRLLALLDNLLDLSMLEAGKVNLGLQRLQMKRVISDALTEFQTSIPAKQIRLEQEYQCGEAYVLGDPLRLGQVVRNLLSNAVKFSPAGGTLRIATYTTRLIDHALPGQELPDMPAVELRVADDGRGIPPGEEIKIFDSFVQSSNTATSAGGTGLGLSISRDIVLAHGGVIYARNRPEGGTEIVVCIPSPML